MPSVPHHTLSPVLSSHTTPASPLSWFKPRPWCNLEAYLHHPTPPDCISLHICMLGLLILPANLSTLMQASQPIIFLARLGPSLHLSLTATTDRPIEAGLGLFTRVPADNSLFESLSLHWVLFLTSIAYFPGTWLPVLAQSFRCKALLCQCL